MTSSPSNTSWVRTIKSPFRKARTLFNNNPNHHASAAATTTKAHKRTKSCQPQGQDDDKKMIDLQLEGEVMACTYEDVQVMWSILDKANNKPRSSLCNVNS
ncbi:TBC1 domain family member 22A like [Heracleum sosnowskyi]|uniref:TBC1 domain family member 22A like n=1 Tax=Heracleum sosnowskyi TaxID=360622 RepID=A0AAD8MVN3_9APIA|nr:TBC1 domain family member 22A like [Heracleum sosnowskyi]